MEGLTLPCGIGFKWPQMALPCQCLVFNVLSGLVVVAKLLTEAEDAGSNTPDYCNSFLFNTKYNTAAPRRGTDTHKHMQSLMGRLVNYNYHIHSLLHCV